MHVTDIKASAVPTSWAFQLQASPPQGTATLVLPLPLLLNYTLNAPPMHQDHVACTPAGLLGRHLTVGMKIPPSSIHTAHIKSLMYELRRNSAAAGHGAAARVAGAAAEAASAGSATWAMPMLLVGESTTGLGIRPILTCHEDPQPSDRGIWVLAHGLRAMYHAHGLRAMYHAHGLRAMYHAHGLRAMYHAHGLRAMYHAHGLRAMYHATAPGLASKESICKASRAGLVAGLGYVAGLVAWAANEARGRESSSAAPLGTWGGVLTLLTAFAGAATALAGVALSAGVASSTISSRESSAATTTPCPGCTRASSPAPNGALTLSGGTPAAACATFPNSTLGGARDGAVGYQEASRGASSSPCSSPEAVSASDPS